MRIDLKFVELHAPLFLAETNFGTKLYSDKPIKGKNLELWYETDLKHTFVVANGEVAMIESTASKTVADISQLKEYVKIKVVNQGTMFSKTDHAAATIKSLPVKAQVSGPGQGITAQVSTPMDKVQGKPGKKAKFQGEETQGE